jgi:flagellar FliJ protein
VKKFSFNLEKVLKLRKFAEDEAKIELGRAVSALNIIENNIKETALKRHNATANRFTDSTQILSWDIYINRLEQETERLMEQAAQAEIVVEEKRKLYLEAQKDLRAIEKLKEKRQQEHRKEMLDYEMAQVDELTAARYNWV